MDGATKKPEEKEGEGWKTALRGFQKEQGKSHLNLKRCGA